MPFSFPAVIRRRNLFTVTWTEHSTYTVLLYSSEYFSGVADHIIERRSADEEKKI
jgi:hypothetical protein